MATRAEPRETGKKAPIVLGRRSDAYANTSGQIVILSKGESLHLAMAINGIRGVPANTARS